jgi:glyoxylase-like metal-dependent hydrolase (beta-lactamase superfamily II)
MDMKPVHYIASIALAVSLLAGSAVAEDNGIPVDRSKYANREMLPDFTATPCPNDPRTLTQVKGNLYRLTTGGHTGLVLITREGAILVDPARTCTAAWFRDEIKNKFQVPVKYVIYTHAHADHISGAQVFQQDGALVVAHKNALEPIVGEKLAMAVPDRIFDKDMKITLGGETVLLHYVAPSHSNSMIMILYPGYKALQCTDVCGNHSMPFNDFPDFYYDGYVETLDWVLDQDVDIVDPGHGPLATKADEKLARDYVVDLHDQVLDLLRKGQSWDELYRNVQFSDEVKKWSLYNERRILNIMGMYRWVSNHRRGEW